MKTLSYYCQILPQSPMISPPSQENQMQTFRFCSSFFFFVLLSSCSSSITQKVYNVHERFTHQMNALLSEIFLFLVRVACELRSLSYNPKQASRWLFCTPFCAYLHAKLDNSRWCEDVLCIERLLKCQRYLFSLLELYARYNQQVRNPITECRHFSIHEFVRTYIHNSKIYRLYADVVDTE